MDERAFQLKALDWEWTGDSDEDSLHEGFGAAYSPQEELSTEDALAVVQDLTRLDCESVCVCGGPIFRRDDWELLARSLRECDISLSLISNGEGLCESAPALAGYFKGVAVTLEGPEAVHDMVKQRTGSFQRALEGLESLAQAGVYTGVVTTVSNHNILHLDALGQIVGEVGASDWLLRTTLASGAARRPGYADYTVLPYDEIYLIEFVARMNQAGDVRVNAGCDIGYFEKEQQIRVTPWSGCTAGIWTAGLEWNGNLKGCLCMTDEWVEGNVHQTPLDVIWDAPDAFTYNRNFRPEDMVGYCKVCPHAFSCACGCIGAAAASTGSRFDNLYCHQRVIHEEQYLADHPPDGGGATLPGTA